MKLMNEVIARIQRSTTDKEAFWQVEEHTEWDAVEELESIAFGNKFVIYRLSKSLSEPQALSARAHLAAALLKLDPGNQKAIAVLHEIIQFTRLCLTKERTFPQSGFDESLLWRVSDCLLRDDHTCQPAIEALQFLAQTCISTTPALPVLYSLGAVDPELAIESFLELMETQPDGFLYDTIGYLFSLQLEDLRSYDRITDSFVQFIQKSVSVMNYSRGWQ